MSCHPGLVNLPEQASSPGCLLPAEESTEGQLVKFRTRLEDLYRRGSGVGGHVPLGAVCSLDFQCERAGYQSLQAGLSRSRSARRLTLHVTYLGCLGSRWIKHDGSRTEANVPRFAYICPDKVLHVFDSASPAMKAGQCAGGRPVSGAATCTMCEDNMSRQLDSLQQHLSSIAITELNRVLAGTTPLDRSNDCHNCQRKRGRVL